MSEILPQAGEVEQIHHLLQNLLSSDNNIRIRSELDFKHLMESNPNIFLFSLIQISLNDSLDLSIRQAALLNLKRIVPLYWSPAFDKYIGPNTINQEIKKLLRDSLLKLIGDPDSKIRSSSGYAIVQIAAVDYPDEWPDLLDYLYNITTNEQSSMFEIIGSLCVLQEIFDDLVSDEQFYEDGIGIAVLKTCQMLLENSHYNLEVKVETLHLLNRVCDSLVNADFDYPNREQFCTVVIPQIFKLVATISQNLSNDNQYINQLFAWSFKHQCYTILNILMNSYPELLNDYITDSFNITLLDLSNEKPFFTHLLSIDIDINTSRSLFVDFDHFYSSQKENLEPFQITTFSIAKKIEFLQTLIELKNLNDLEVISNICNILLPLSRLSNTEIDDYHFNFNKFVTMETSLNDKINVRDAIRDFLSDINAKDNLLFINLLVQKFDSIGNINIDKLELESLFYLLACCFDNDDTIIGSASFDIDNFISKSIELATNESLLSEDFQFLVSRIILMIPKFMFKYESKCKTYGIKPFEKILSIIPKLGESDDYLITKSSILISLQYYNYFVRAKEFNSDIQHQLLNLVNQLKEDSDEDTDLMLLDVMTIIIAMDNKTLSKDEKSINLILTIGFKNDSSFALNTSLFECIEDLIKDIPEEDYWKIISNVFPFLLQKISEFNGEYNSQIDLSLQIITVFLENKSYRLTTDIFQSTFSTITKFIFACNDDELLQSSSECLIKLVNISTSLCSSYIDKESHESGVQTLLKCVSKFLSPSMTDRAIVNLGDLVTLLLEKFNNLIGNYLEDILKALTVRLVQAKEVPTIENMILIFNMLAIAQPQTTVNFLKSFTIDDNTALSKVLPIWFQAYEVMRGYESILSNIRAFIEIFKLNDDSINNIIVDGDPIQPNVPEGVIITRSMSKKIPVTYEKIPANVKIIKLLLDELKNDVTASKTAENEAVHIHSHGHDHEHYGDAEDDDGWEDLEDVEPTFEHLKNYVEEDGSVKRASDSNNNDMRQLLIHFFKDCTTNNTANFESIYNNYLTDNQKSLLSEYLVFT